MPLFGLAIIPLVVILVLAVMACRLYWDARVAKGALAMAAGKLALQSPAGAWRVEAHGTDHWVEVDRYICSPPRMNIAETVQIRLVGPGRASVVFATVAIRDEDYEEQIRAAVARGEERALTLNALLTL